MKQDKYISIREAAQITGKTEKTIRNLLDKTGENEAVKREGRMIMIERSFLEEHYKPAEQGEEARLRAEVERLQEEIAWLKEVLAGTQESLRVAQETLLYTLKKTGS